YGEAGRGANGGYDGKTGHDGFLDQFEAGPAAEQEDVLVKGQVAFQEGVTDQLVEGVVTADVFFDDEEVALAVEETGGMKTAGAIEEILSFPKQVGEWIEHSGVYRQGSLAKVSRAHRIEGLDTYFAADAATGAGIKMTLQLFEIRGYLGGQLDADGVCNGGVA